MIQLPETIAKEISDKIDVLYSKSVFINSDDPQLLEVYGDLSKLENANHALSNDLRAFTLSLTGAMSDALAKVTPAATIRSSLYQLCIFANFGFNTNAQQIFAEFCDPKSGSFTANHRLGRACGAHRCVAEFTREAQKMNISHIDKLPLNEIYAIESMLQKFEISDSKVAEFMDIAGKLLVEFGYFPMGDGPSVCAINVPGELETLEITYRVATESMTAMALHLEFFHRCEEADKVIPEGLCFNFIGAK